LAPADNPRRPRRPRPKRDADPIREAAAEGSAGWADPTPAEAEDSAEWADPTPAEAWDPWGDADAGAEARGLNRTLGEWLEAVVPPEAQVHFLTAATEFAAGVQTTLEHHLGGGTTGEDDDGTRAVRIEIQ
jgi:hypothetical protein